MSRLRCASLVALAALLAASAAGAQTASPARPGDPGADWQPRTEAVIDQLRSGRWAEAESGARSVLSEMVEWIAGGPGAPRSLALMMALQALGEAGLGRDGEAIWHWQVAQQMAPEISGMNMAPFGAAGAALLGKTPRRDCGGAARPTTAGVVKPSAVERPRPVYPDGLRSAGVHGKVIVEVLVGADGVPREPRVLTPHAPPPLVFAAAESLLRSRFTPARLGAEAVPFCFASSVRFELVEETER